MSSDQNTDLRDRIAQVLREHPVIPPTYAGDRSLGEKASITAALILPIVDSAVKRGQAEALRDAANDLNARANGPELIAAADRWAGYYSGVRTAIQNEETALRLRAGRIEEETR